MTDGASAGATETVRVDAGNLGWRLAFRVMYRLVRHLRPVVRLMAATHVPTYDDRILELDLVGRLSGKPRIVLVTLITLDGRWYVGHPNGRAGWLANLEALTSVTATLLGRPPVRVRAVPLTLGPEREAVIRATARQQPILARTLYRAAQGHILRAGVYDRLELV